MKTLSILFAVALIMGGLATSSTHSKLQMFSLVNFVKVPNYQGLEIVGDD